METQNLDFNPTLEIINIDTVDIVGTSYLPGNNETPLVPPGYLF